MNMNKGIILFLLFVVVLVSIVQSLCIKEVVLKSDDCQTLSNRCNITVEALLKYNPDIEATSCDQFKDGEKICCSSGGLTPVPHSNGDCASIEIIRGDSCYSIALEYGLTEEQIELYNKDTWRWFGCNNLQETKICVSSGTPPKPNTNPTAECGPTAPITYNKPYNSSCPLNLCCSQWGYCGSTLDFCQVTKSPTNAPGTKGCVSNCEMNYKPTPSHGNNKFLSVGYLESWSIYKPCLNESIPSYFNKNNVYSHVHFAFATINSNLSISYDQKPFEQFKNASGNGKKKVVSFGGWSFSTDPETSEIFRLGFAPGPQRKKLISNLNNFLTQHSIDGLDFDWEYPGAEDLGGQESDGENYISFLRDLQLSMPDSKSISITLPASYWYLKNYPLQDISFIDYVVFKTFDLHGPWDYDVKYLGPYLRSHVNITETIQALTMITKAGVPSYKILMGIGSYGRSFQQKDPLCAGPNCVFKNPSFGALPGKCTQTSGYLSLSEIEDILIQKTSVRAHYYDKYCDSQVLLYGKDQWVAYLTPDLIYKRIDLAKKMNLGGFFLKR